MTKARLQAGRCSRACGTPQTLARSGLFLEALDEPTSGRARWFVLPVDRVHGKLAAMQLTAGHAQQPLGDKESVKFWYEAFDKHDPALIDKILSPDWVDIPAMPNQAA
jgi:hypothetical protein